MLLSHSRLLRARSLVIQKNPTKLRGRIVGMSFLMSLEYRHSFYHTSQKSFRIRKWSIFLHFNCIGVIGDTGQTNRDLILSTDGMHNFSWALPCLSVQLCSQLDQGCALRVPGHKRAAALSTVPDLPHGPSSNKYPAAED